MRPVILLFLTLLLAVTTTAAHAGDDVDAEIERLDGELAEKEDPARAEHLLERAALHRLRGDFGAALADLNELTDLEPELPEACLERALVFVRLRYLDDAERDLSSYLHHRPHSEPALLERAEVRAELGKLQLARADYREALAASSAKAEIYGAMCRLDEEQGDLDGAALCYSKGLDELHDALVLRHALARVETSRRNYDRAIELLDTLIDNPALRISALLDRAEAYEEAGKDGLAERDRALALRYQLAHRQRGKGSPAAPGWPSAADPSDDQPPSLEQARELLRRGRAGEIPMDDPDLDP